jgi:hypothetical protein
MSRSRKRRPFMAVTGSGSAKQDKIIAHRGERRAHTRALIVARKQDYEDFLPPKRLECAWNNTYSWGRDGSQMYWKPARYGHENWFLRMMRK